MSQGALQVQTTSPLTGVNEVTQTNTALAALASLSSGATAPTLGPGGAGALVEGQLWLNTSASPHCLMIYSTSATWVPFFSPLLAYLHANCGGFI